MYSCTFEYQRANQKLLFPAAMIPMGKRFRMKERSLYVGECQDVYLVGIVLYTTIIHVCI